MSGSFSDDDGSYHEGTWLRLPPGSSHTIRTETGAKVWRKTGHLG
ncbi:MAG: cupin domain-containing protein [Roseibium sp.]